MNTLINQLNDYLEPIRDEHEQPEGTLRESLKLAASILQTVREGLLILDADLYVRVANRFVFYAPPLNDLLGNWALTE